MAYPIASQDIVELLFWPRQESQQFISTFHYRYTGASPITDGAAALDAMLTQQMTSTSMFKKYLQCMGSDATTLQLTAQKVFVNRYVRFTKATIVGYQGGEVDALCLPTANAVAITRRGEEAIRGRVGTLHMPCIPYTFIEPGSSLLLNIGQDAYSALALKMLETITLSAGQTFVPILLHRTLPGISPQITSVDLHNELRTERRRVLGRGI